MKRRVIKHRAMILIIVLVAVAALSLGALAFSALMVSEREVVHMTGRQIQATALAESGLEMARLFLAEQPDVQFSDGVWYDNLESFQGVLLLDSETPQGRGRFAIVAPADDQNPGGVRFGLECESAKLNLNTLLEGKGPEGGKQSPRDRLMLLPGMSEEIADSILDWLDADDEPREFGAEAEYYESLDPPYHPTNGPMQCLEELLFVRGITRELLYGSDRNRNGKFDTDESDTAAGAETDAAGSISHRGWSAYLTLCSREMVVQADGSPKIDLNQSDAKQLFTQLEEVFDREWATFIVGYRQQEQLYSEDGLKSPQGKNKKTGNKKSRGGGSKGKTPSGGGSGKGSSSPKPTEEKLEQQEHASGELDLKKPLSQQFKSVLDLIGCKIKIKYKDSKQSTVVAPLFPDDADAMREYLPRLMEYVTIGGEKTLSGRVNVNLAAASVLAGVPGVGAALADDIVGRRPEDPTSVDTHQRNPTWLLTDGLVKLDKMKALLPYLTAGGSVYKVQTVGFFDRGGPIVRLEATIDASESPPRVLSLKNLTPLGPGFDPMELGAEE